MRNTGSHKTHVAHAQWSRTGLILLDIRVNGLFWNRTDQLTDRRTVCISETIRSDVLMDLITNTVTETGDRTRFIG